LAERKGFGEIAHIRRLARAPRFRARRNVDLRETRPGPGRPGPWSGKSAKAGAEMSVRAS
jgi:hypothetical protein